MGQVSDLPCAGRKARATPVKRLAFVPLALALAASVFWLAYHSGELLRVNGPWALAVLAFPVVVSAAPLVFAGRALRGIAAATLCAFALIGSMSVGANVSPSSPHYARFVSHRPARSCSKPYSAPAGR